MCIENHAIIVWFRDTLGSERESGGVFCGIIKIAVAKRAREITDDIILKGKVVEEKPVNMAIQELKNDKYNIIAPD